MAGESKQPDSSPERRLPTKAQIRAAAYGNRQPGASSVALPADLPEPQPAAQAPARSADDTWIIAATRADGWHLQQCEQLLRAHKIETQLATSGISSVRVRRSDYSAAIRKLQEQKAQLWSKPGGRANLIVSVAFIVMLVLMILGGVMVTGMLNQGRGNDDTRDITLFAIVLPVVVLVVFGLLTAFRRR